MQMKRVFDSTSLMADARAIRVKILEMSAVAEGGHHLGGGLSMVELMCYLYGFRMNVSPETTESLTRDRFILSKGHGVLGFYPVLQHYGFISANTLSSYKSFGSELIAHPIKNLDNGIESSNGSLGHGLSYGSGIAYALSSKDIDAHTYVLMGDGECNEGSVWEAAMSAGTLGLDGLTAVIDLNGYQSDGPTEDISKACRLQDMFNALGWATVEVDGHCYESIHKGFELECAGRPKAILAKTIKGKGFREMENNNFYHHARITKASFETLMNQVSKG